MDKEAVDADLNKLAISIDSIKIKHEQDQLDDIQTQDDHGDSFDDEELCASTQLIDYGRLIVLNKNQKRLGMTRGIPTAGGDLTELSFLVKGENFAVGRDINICQLVVQKEFVNEKLLCRMSRVHFTITKNVKDWENSPVIITDKSRNGTWVNGDLLGCEKSRILLNKDKIAVFNKRCNLFEYRDTFVRAVDLPKTVTNQYFVENKLGSGAFGEVFKVLSINTVERFAVKHIKIANLSLYKKIKDESLNEAGIMRSLHHPCIIQLVDIMCSDKYSTTLVMEYMAGGDLLHRITGSEKGYLSESSSQCFFYQVVLALQYLHSKKISHRDIKPDNVLLKDDSELTVVKLTDFGLSKFVGNDTALKSLIGTPNYVAPEILQCRELGNYSEQVDVWSLGVLLFACLSGTLPFAEEYGGTIQDQITKGRYSFLASCWKKVASTPKRLIQRMLTVAPSVRITVSQLLESDWVSRDLPVIQETQQKLELERELIKGYRLGEEEKKRRNSEDTATPGKRRRVE